MNVESVKSGSPKSLLGGKFSHHFRNQLILTFMHVCMYACMHVCMYMYVCQVSQVCQVCQVCVPYCTKVQIHCPVSRQTIRPRCAGQSQQFQFFSFSSSGLCNTCSASNLLFSLFVNANTNTGNAKELTLFSGVNPSSLMPPNDKILAKIPFGCNTSSFSMSINFFIAI